MEKGGVRGDGNASKVEWKGKEFWMGVSEWEWKNVDVVGSGRGQERDV